MILYIIYELTSKKVLPKTSPNYLQYKIHKRWLLSWIHFIVIICVTTLHTYIHTYFIDFPKGLFKD